NNQGGGTLFARQDFTYDPATDSFQCPAGKTLSLKQLNGRFLVRHFSGVRAEMAMAVQAYNLKRAISVLGARRMI
ncbi:hypothetical protein ACNFCJ_24200, partial [Pseudomonas sp. NY15364]